MPTYQYACTNAECGHRFELVQSFSDPALRDCPVCAGHLRKVYGSVGVVFKGSGFYRTDSRNDGRGRSEISNGKKAELTGSATSSESGGTSSSGSSSTSTSSGSGSSSASGAGTKVAASA